METSGNKYCWDTNLLDGSLEAVYCPQAHGGTDVLDVAYHLYDVPPCIKWPVCVSERTRRDIEHAKYRVTTYRSMIDGRQSTLGYNGSRFYEAAKTLLQLSENLPWYVGRADFRIAEHMAVDVNPEAGFTEITYGIQFGFSKKDYIHGVLRMSYHQNVPPDIAELFQIYFEFPIEGKTFYVGNRYSEHAVGYQPDPKMNAMTPSCVFPAPSVMQVDFAKTFNDIYNDPIMKPILMDLAVAHNDRIAKEKAAKPC